MLRVGVLLSVTVSVRGADFEGVGNGVFDRDAVTVLETVAEVEEEIVGDAVDDQECDGVRSVLLEELDSDVDHVADGEIDTDDDAVTTLDCVSEPDNVQESDLDDVLDEVLLSETE